METLRGRRNSDCPMATMCKSQWGYCGNGPMYCGESCQAGPCLVSNDENIIDEKNFRCVFNNLNQTIRSQRFNGLQQSGWKPQNRDEAAVFLAHVYHETDGLKTLKEYCAPGMFD
jgi:hypothetical protein